MSTPSPSPPPLPPIPPPSSSHSAPQSSSNLYLVTFLATLFILLFVSSSIVLRSYLLRRRFQQRLEEAMGSGLLLAPHAQGSKRRRLGTKPKMMNAWLAAGGEKWHQMMPLSAQPVFVKRKIRDNSGAKNKSSDTTTAQPSTNVLDATADDPPPTESSSRNVGPNRMMNLFSRFRRSPLHHDSAQTELAHTDAKNAKQGPNYKIRVEMLQLSVLILMPSPNKSQRKNHMLDNTDVEKEEADDEDSELPDMVFGVTRVNYRQPKSIVQPTTQHI